MSEQPPIEAVTDEAGAAIKRAAEFSLRRRKYIEALHVWKQSLEEFHKNVNLQVCSILVMSPTHLEISTSSSWRGNSNKTTISYKSDGHVCSLTVQAPKEPEVYREHNIFSHWDWTDADHDNIQTVDENWRLPTLEEQYGEQE